MPHKYPVKRKLYASRKKKYGKVKPLKPTKLEPRVPKPSTVELRSIYARLRKCTSWQMLDLLAETVQWYRRMVAFLYASTNSQNPNVLNKVLLKYPSLLKLQLAREKELRLAHQSQRENRMFHLIKSIQMFEEEMRKFGVKVPSLDGSLKKAKKSGKKFDVRRAQVEKKFDSLLTTLEAATNLDVELGAVPAMVGSADFNYDQTLDKMLYTRGYLTILKKRIRREGILPVFLEQIFFVARSAAMREEAQKSGRYIVNGHAWANTIGRGMQNLCKWLSANPDAPNKLIKRTVPRKKRPKKSKLASTSAIEYLSPIDLSTDEDLSDYDSAIDSGGGT